MEPPIYARHGIDARFVGHPMADDIPLQGNRDEARAALGLPATARASFGCYNTPEEVDQLVRAVVRAREVFC
jgi:lipid A disaccharide synthetase